MYHYDGDKRDRMHLTEMIFNNSTIIKLIIKTSNKRKKSSMIIEYITILLKYNNNNNKNIQKINFHLRENCTTLMP